MNHSSPISEIVAIVGINAAIEIARRIGGQKVWIPSARRITSDLRDDSVMLDLLSGETQESVAERHHISTRTVQRIRRSRS